MSVAVTRSVMTDADVDELHRLRAEVQHLRGLSGSNGTSNGTRNGNTVQSDAHQPMTTSDLVTETPAASHSHSPLHALLLLADTALPLGAFAYSAGLESYLAHHHLRNRQQQQQQQQQQQTSEGKLGPDAKLDPARLKRSADGKPGSSEAKHPPTKAELLHSFLHQSLSTCARAALPFVLAAYDEPARLYELDDMYDATVSCLVARRQSAETGRALLGAWMRGLGLVGAFQPPPPTTTAQPSDQDVHGLLATLDAALRATSAKQAEGADPALHHGHVAPLWGAVGRAAGVSRHDAAYVFLLNHVRGLLSAAVRTGVLGPFKQLAMLADVEVRSWIEEGVRQAEHLIRTKGVQAAGQVVPMNDIWGGRHEILYSRVFNS